MVYVPRIGVFIDGANFHASAKELRLNIDYKKLLELFSRLGFVVHVSFYTAIYMDDTGTIAIKPMLDWLSYNGYLVKTKDAKEFDTPTGTKLKGNMDIEMAIDAMLLSDRIDVCYLFTGDGDFAYLINVLQNKGVRVHVLSTETVVADELRRAADNFTDLKTWVPHIRRTGDNDA